MNNENYYIFTSDGELYHWGVKGMKWGVRRYQNKDGSLTPAGKKRYEVDDIVRQRDALKINSKTSKGSEVMLDHNHTPAFTKFMARHNMKVRELLKNSKSFKITANGKIVGEMDLYKESPDSLNIVWVGVNGKHEGNGYGTAAMKGAIQYAKQTGCRQVTLEVPGNSPNARHIYEKLGFKSTGEVLGDKDDVWGGLTKMRLDLDDHNKK